METTIKDKTYSLTINIKMPYEKFAELDKKAENATGGEYDGRDDIKMSIWEMLQRKTEMTDEEAEADLNLSVYNEEVID